MEFEPRGHVELDELQRLSRSVPAGWRVDRVQPALRDNGPARTLVADRARIVARADGELAGAVAVALDPESSRLYGKDTWRVSALVARDTVTEAALLIEASRTVADHDLLYFRFCEVGEMPRIDAPGFSVIGRAATFGRLLEAADGTAEAQHPRDPDDREALMAIASEVAEQPLGSLDAASLERSREFNADRVATALAQPRLVVVSRDAGRVTGFALLSSGSRLLGCIDLLGVAHSERRRGFGARLVAAAAAAGRREGWEGLLVATSRDNHAAVHLYASSGFRELGDLVLLRRCGQVAGES